MFNNNTKGLRDTLRHFPWARIGYPIGVIMVFVVIFTIFFFAYRFFNATILRITTISFGQQSIGARYPLARYKVIAPFFGFTPPSSSLVKADPALVLTIDNAQTRNDRVALVQKILTDAGFTPTVLSGNDKSTIHIYQSTIVQMKKGKESMAQFIVRLLEKEGFATTVAATPLADNARADVHIILGSF